MIKSSNLQKLQENLKNKNIDIFIINRTDEFLNEYIAPYAERLKWLTNFSGSAGRAIIGQNTANLFVDGRYTFQAKEQINGKEISLKHYEDFWIKFKSYCKFVKSIAIDPKLHSIKEIEKFLEYTKDSDVKLVYLDNNPIDKIWKKQPKKKYSKVFDHPIKFAGLGRETKIKKFQNLLKRKNLNCYLITSLDSIAWILNIRGNDIQYTPIAFSYLLIPSEGKARLYISINNLSKKLKNNLLKNLHLHSINKINSIFIKLLNKKKIGIDFQNTSYYFYKLAFKSELIIKNIPNPCLLPKAEKNSTELDGARKAHIRDGVSITKFLCWLKNLKDFNSKTEMNLGKKLYLLRKNNEFFHSISFDSISAVGKNAALPHYRVNKNNNSKLFKNSIYLIDSGAQYYDGTTDITRTIIIGTASKEQKDRFTRVLKGHIKLTSHVFKKGTTGSDVDYLARESLNEIGLDYDHGTGHGIGSFLSVHEGPQRIAKKGQFQNIQLMPGMILSNEPGFYKEGEYGIRIENIIVVKEKDKKNLEFENISWAPIDKDLIVKEMLSEFEIKWINNYHKKVYDNLNNFVNLKERKWLQNVTTPL